MNLLLTRSATDSARTREKLEALGHTVIVSPVIGTVAIDAVWPAEVVDGVMATSAKAFSAKLKSLSPETKRLLPLFVVGQRTAEAARERGFLGTTIIAPTAAALATAYAQGGRRKRLVYLAGRDRRPDLETALADSGQTLDILEVYEARPTGVICPEALRAASRQRLDGVLHFSPRSAALFIADADAARLEVRPLAHFCLSGEVAAPLLDLGCSKVQIAASPSEADVLTLVGKAR